MTLARQIAAPVPGGGAISLSNVNAGVVNAGHYLGTFQPGDVVTATVRRSSPG